MVKDINFWQEYFGILPKEKPSIPHYFFNPFNEIFAGEYAKQVYKLTSSESLRKQNPEGVAHTLAWGRAIKLFEGLFDGDRRAVDKLKHSDPLNLLMREYKESFNTQLYKFIQYKKLEGREKEAEATERLNEERRRKGQDFGLFR
jgi:hypothetical protein